MKLEEYVLKNYSKMNETDLFIWEYIVQNKHKVETFTISELARETSVSRTTISRFVKKMGLSGFSEFKVLLKMGNKDHKIIDTTIYDDACDSIVQYIEEQRHKNYEEVCELIFQAKRIFIYGTGDIQNAVAKQFKRMFMSCQEIVYDIGGSTFDKATFNVIQEGDLIILISLRGNNDSIIRIANECKIRGAKIISITEFKSNRLADSSHAKLYISSTKLQILENHPDYKLTMLYFVLVELLFIKYTTFKRMKMFENGLERNTL